MSNTLFETYAGTSLASVGFAFMRGDLGSFCRPDLLKNGLQASGELATGARARIHAWQQIRRFKVEIEGFGATEVVARSEQGLAGRIEAVLGARVVSMVPVSDDTATTPVGPSVPRTSWHTRTGDLYEGTKTREGPRTCDECDAFTAGHTCRVSQESGITRPAWRAPRRCLAFVPEFVNRDPRTGRELWPELVGVALPAPSMAGSPGTPRAD